jgi:hypothetical protein
MAGVVFIVSVTIATLLANLARDETWLLSQSLGIWRICSLTTLSSRPVGRIYNII